MLIVILLSILQAAIFTTAQVLLKIALTKMQAFSFSWQYFYNLLTNWTLLFCGICFAAGSLLWFYILKRFPFSLAFPLTSLSYVFALIAGIFVFKENISAYRYIGVALIMLGCCLSIK